MEPENKNSLSSLSTTSETSKPSKLTITSKFINKTTKILIIIIINMISIKNYLKNYNKEIPNLTSYIYINYFFGIIYTLFLSGNLNLLKTFSFSQIIYFSFLIKKYDFENIKIIGIILVVYYFVFFRFKFYKLYLFIPRSFLFGLKFVFGFFFVFIQFFNFDEIQFFPLQFNFRYLIQNFVFVKSQIILSKFIFFIIFIFLFMIIFKKFKFKKFPETFFILLISILFGLLYQNINKKYQNSIFFEFDINFKKIMHSFDNNIFKFGNLEILKNKYFYLDTLIFSIINLIEFSCSLSILKIDTNSKIQGFKEFLIFIIINIIQIILGLFPISIDFGSNLQIKSFNGNKKKYFCVVLIFIIFYPIFFNKAFDFCPIVISSGLFCAFTICSVKFKDFKNLWFLNKTGIFWILFVFFLFYFFDFFFTMFFAMLLFFIIYMPFTDKIFFSVFKSEKYFEKKEMLKNSNLSSDDEENNKLLISENYEINEEIKKEGIIYEFKKNQFNFATKYTHINILKEFQNKNIIFDFKICLNSDINFLHEYFEILKDLQDNGKSIFVTGFYREYFENGTYDKWLMEMFVHKQVLFFEDD